MSILRIVIVILTIMIFGVAGGMVLAADNHDKIITVAYENSEYYPWSMPDGKGLDIDVLNEIAGRLKFKVNFVALPWNECLKSLKENKVDAVLNASYSEDRAEYAIYPMLDNKVTSDFRMHMDSYNLYKFRTLPVEWKDGKIINYDGVIEVQKGYSVGIILRDAGANVSEKHVSISEIFKDMYAGKISVAALNGFSADYFLKTNTAYAEKIVKAPDRIIYKPYYLIFSKDAYKKDPEFIQKIWENIRDIRTSSMYSNLLTTYLKK